MQKLQFGRLQQLIHMG